MNSIKSFYSSACESIFYRFSEALWNLSFYNCENEIKNKVYEVDYTLPEMFAFTKSSNQWQTEGGLIFFGKQNEIFGRLFSEQHIYVKVK
jgi:hypothetical protein